MEQFLQYTVFGLVAAAIYAVAASGLVVTYTTSGIFNFAHGAVGMMGAFAYWQLSQGWGWNPVLSLVLVLLVLAPLFGALLDLVIMRGLEGTSEVTRTVVTVGVLFALVALAPVIWPPNTNRIVTPFFPGKRVEIFGVNVSYHQLITIGVAIAVAILLRLLLYRTRAGIAMRAVVSNRSLVQLIGGRPGRSSALSWSLGSSLAALAGILIAERLGGLEPFMLTLVVMSAYAAAIVGRLASLPMTFVGAIILGLAESYAVSYMPANPSWMPEGINLVTSLRLAIPVILLFVVLLLLPQAPLRAHGMIRLRESVPRPSWNSGLVAAGVLIAAAVLFTQVLDSAGAISWGKAFAFGLIMLSLVPLTGYGGQISLAQMAFAGLGAFAMSVWGAGGNPLGLVAAVALPAVVGAVVALPALRLRGIYLALATLAFGVFMDRVVFLQHRMFPAGTRTVDRPEFLGLEFRTNQSYFVFMAVVFALAGLFVLWLRRGRFGRRLQAMKDSPAACATLGLNLTVTKLQVFAISAGIAGLGGAMLSSLQGTATVTQFDTLQGLPILLLAVAGGIALISGALIGGFIYAVLPLLADAIPALGTLFLVGPGLIGITLGRNPNGMASGIMNQYHKVRARIAAPRRSPTPDEDPGSSLLPGGPTYDAELVGISRPFTPRDVAYIDRALALDPEEVGVGAPRG